MAPSGAEGGKGPVAEAGEPGPDGRTATAAKGRGLGGLKARD